MARREVLVMVGMKEFQVLLMFPGYKALALVSMTKVAECAEECAVECVEECAVECTVKCAEECTVEWVAEWVAECRKSFKCSSCSRDTRHWH